MRLNFDELEITMRIKMIIATLLLMATVVVSAQGLKTTIEEDRKAEIPEMLALDCRMLIIIKEN